MPSRGHHGRKPAERIPVGQLHGLWGEAPGPAGMGSRPATAGKATAQPSQSGTSYAVSEAGVWAMRAARICASCRCSRAVSASPRALAMKRSSPAQHRLRQLVSPGNRPIAAPAT